MNNRPVGGGNSEMLSHLIAMIIIKVILWDACEFIIFSFEER
jgi:hypothetical protein